MGPMHGTAETPAATEAARPRPGPTVRLGVAGAPDRTAAGPDRGSRALWAGTVQRTAGNQALSRLMVQRQSRPAPADPAPPPGTPAADRKPEDLTGTPFESLDPTLKTKLADKSVYDWKGKPTLAEALNEESNANLAAIARVAAMITASAAFLWKYVSAINGAWVTDNFGVGFSWNDPGSLTADLVGSGNFCRDNPVTARWYHGSPNAFRQIPGSPGSPSLHVITGGHTDVHIDLHQPIEGKETGWFAGQCNLDLGAWWDHAGDVVSGGGATGTAVGRFGVARGNLTDLRSGAVEDETRQLDVAKGKLDSIMYVVQKYAAMGAMVGNEFEGDRQMLADKATMKTLEEAEGILVQVRTDRTARRQRENREADPYRFGPKY
ncbi:hypothetical protein [Nakamurella sp.]|uniref:hypothetical protein n=1 Tax=Nakamurella sp. TaxID=1869182 RepID=UPI003783D74C